MLDVVCVLLLLAVFVHHCSRTDSARVKQELLPWHGRGVHGDDDDDAAVLLLLLLMMTIVVVGRRGMITQDKGYHAHWNAHWTSLESTRRAVVAKPQFVKKFIENDMSGMHFHAGIQLEKNKEDILG